MSIAQDIQRAIHTIAKQIVLDAPYDKTRNGQVVGHDINTNTYTIMLDGVKYSNIPITDGLMANVNDTVKVVFPTNNPSQMYISNICCLGTVSIKQDPLLYLDVVVDSDTGRATSGTDKDLYNAIVDLGWASDVIV